jgi:hypothetical protein
MSSSDPPIIITGGSVTVEFDLGTLKSNGNGRHHHPDKQIKRVEVVADGIDIAENIKDGKVTIKIFYGNK